MNQHLVDTEEFDVSVVVPVYNAEHFVAAAVRSALAQPQTGEVLLVEDGSTDGSLEECRRLAAGNDRIKLLQHPGGENRGAAASRNRGIEHSSCEFVAFLDVDDLYLPGRFETAEIRFADRSIDGVYEGTGIQFDDDASRLWWQSHRKCETNLTAVTEDVPPEELFEALMSEQVGWFHTNAVTVRRSLFERTGLFDEPLKMCQDSCLWLKMAMVGRLVRGRSDGPVSIRRLHGKNRIYTNRGRTHREWGHRMFLTLLGWSYQHPIPASRRVLLHEAVLRTWHRARPPHERAYARVPKETWLLLSTLAREPRIVRSREFRERASQCLGPALARNVVAGLARRMRPGAKSRNGYS